MVGHKFYEEENRKTGCDTLTLNCWSEGLRRLAKQFTLVPGYLSEPGAKSFTEDTTHL